MSVFLDKVDKYELRSLETSIAKALSALKLNLNDKKCAVLKPNIVRAVMPNSGVITHPTVVEAAINVLREIGIGKIIIAEGPSIDVDVKKAFEISGYLALSRKKGVGLIDLNEAVRTEVKWDYGSVELPKVLMDADLYISLPKMKTHVLTTISLSVKNQQGIFSRTGKKDNHRLWGLNEPIVKSLKVLSPDFVIVDGIVAMEGEGPVNGKKKQAGVMVYGTNPIETDCVCCHVMGIDPTDVVHLSYGAAQGLGNTNPQILGNDPQKMKMHFTRGDEASKQSLRYRSWRNIYVCSACEHAFENAMEFAIHHPKYWLSYVCKFGFFSLFTGFNLIRGRNAKVPDNSGRVLCLGDCTKQFADENHFSYVQGCPPNPEDTVKAFHKVRWFSNKSR